jgi:hypothetical protein
MLVEMSEGGHEFPDGKSLPEDEFTRGPDALSATGEEAVTGVEADGASGGLGSGRDGGSRATLAGAVAVRGESCQELIVLVNVLRQERIVTPSHCGRRVDALVDARG